jgi:phosphonate transport system ATP-binding protein
MISAKHLQKKFSGAIALADVNLEVKPGEFVAIIGLSGAGKSTFLRAINGSVKPESGELIVLGQNVKLASQRELRELRKKIGFIFQQFNLVKNVSVLQNVLVGRIAYTSLWRGLLGLFSPEDRALAKKVIDSVGLEGRYHEPVRNLSGGQQQRVAIARALVQEPEIILADEPMASLDPRLAEMVIQMLARINREQGITVLVNIHMLALAKKYAQRIVAFRHGTVVYDGNPDGLSEEKVEELYRFNESEGVEQ